MKTAVIASLVIHLAGLFAVPTGSTEPASEARAAAAKTDSCKCDLEIESACTPPTETR